MITMIADKINIFDIPVFISPYMAKGTFRLVTSDDLLSNPHVLTDSMETAKAVIVLMNAADKGEL